MLTVLVPIAKYLRRGTKLGSLANLDTSWASMIEITINGERERNRETHADSIPIHNTGLSGALAWWESQTSLNSGPSSNSSDGSGRHLMPASRPLITMVSQPEGD